MSPADWWLIWELKSGERSDNYSGSLTDDDCEELYEWLQTTT